MTVKKRIAAAMAANAFSQVVNIGSQLLLTPLFFSHWGAERYGEWLLLSGIPAYLAFADIGIGSAAGNEMTMRAANGDRAGAQRTFRGALLLACAAAGLAIALGFGIAILVFLVQPFQLSTLAGAEGALVLSILVLYVGVSFIGTVLSNGFLCCGRNATGILISNLIRIAEACVTATLLIAEARPIWIAVGITVIRLTGLLIQFRLLKGIGKWLFMPREPADIMIWRRLLQPSLAFLAFPVGNALLLQGPLLVIGTALGGVAVALFATSRTVARIPLQVTHMLNASTWPEMTRAYGLRNTDLLRRLHRESVSAALYISLILALSLSSLGPWIVHAWIGNALQYDALLMNTLLVITFMSAVWNSSSIILAATNRHIGYGLVFIVSSLICVLAASLLVKIAGMQGVTASLIAFEVVVGMAVIRMSLKLARDFLWDFLTSVFRRPFTLLLTRRKGE